MSRLRNVVFTAFEADYGPEWKEYMKKLGESTHVAYCVGQLEKCPETGRLHIQGYMELTGQLRFNRIKEILGSRVHFSRRFGSQSQAIEYCQKEDSREEPYVEYGEKKDVSGERKRSDLIAVKEDIDAGMEWKELCEVHFKACMMYERALKNHLRERKEKEEEAKLLSEFTTAALRPWQTDMLSRLKAQTDRQILWCFEGVGNVGKSWFSMYLEVIEGAFVIPQGKHADAAYRYNYEEIVVMDIPRCGMREDDSSLYMLLERFKDGRVFSPKYESRKKYRRPTKMIVFANEEPNRNRLSEDRWDVVNLSELIDDATSSVDSTGYTPYGG